MRRLEIHNDLEIEKIIPRFCPFCKTQLSEKNTPFPRSSCYYVLRKEAYRGLWHRLWYRKKIRSFVCGTYKIIIDFCSCGSNSCSRDDFEIVMRDRKKLNNIPFLGRGFEFKL